MEACNPVSSVRRQGVALLRPGESDSRDHSEDVGTATPAYGGGRDCRANRLSSGTAQSRVQAHRMGTVTVSGSRCNSEVGRQKAKQTSRELIGEHIFGMHLSSGSMSALAC